MFGDKVCFQHIFSEWSWTLIELRCICHWRRIDCQSVKLNTQSTHNISSIQISFRNMTPSTTRAIIHPRVAFLPLFVPSLVVWISLMIQFQRNTKWNIWEYHHATFSIKTAVNTRQKNRFQNYTVIQIMTPEYGYAYTWNMRVSK